MADSDSLNHRLFGHPLMVERLICGFVPEAMAGLGVSVPIPEDLTEVKTMLATLGETWKQEWLAEGKVETLILLAEYRFGPLSQNLRQRIEAADVATNDGWLHRLLDATSAETLFDLGH
jgi:hypothetical protein